MIPKISCGSSLSGLVDYHERKVAKQKADRIGGHNMLDSSSRNAIVDSLLLYQNLYTGKSEALTFHVSLSLAPKEHLDPFHFTAVADSFMDKMGYGLQPYQIYEHRDRGHQHIHIVSTRVNLEGRLISDSMINRKAVRMARAVELEFGLQVVSSFKKGETFNNGNDLNGVKTTVQTAVMNALHERKVTTFSELSAILKENNIEAAIIHETKMGKKLATPGIAFYLAGEDSARWTKGIAGSKFDPSFTYKDLEKILGENRIESALAKEISYANRVKAGLDLFYLVNEKGATALEDALFEHGLRPVYKYKNGTIYGLTIQDNQTRESLEPDSIGQGYKWSELRVKLDIPTHRDERILEENEKRLAEEKSVKSRPMKERALSVFKEFATLDKSLPQLEELLAVQHLYASYKEVGGGPYELTIHDTHSAQMLKPGDLDPAYSWAKLQRELVDVTNPQKNLLALYSELTSMTCFTEGDLQEKLNVLGVQAELARNTGGVYGISFRDIDSIEQHKASDIHANLSWNKLKHRFGDELKPQELLATVTARLAGEMAKITAPQGISQTILLQHFSRNGINLAQREGVLFMELDHPKVSLPAADILKGKSFEEHFQVLPKSVSKETNQAIKRGEPLLASFKGNELGTYNSLVDGSLKAAMSEARRATVLPPLSPRESETFGPAVKQFYQAQEFFQGLRKTELLIQSTSNREIGTEFQNFGRTNIEISSLIKIINRQGVGVELIESGKSFQPRFFHGDNPAITLKEGEYSKLITQELKESIYRAGTKHAASHIDHQYEDSLAIVTQEDKMPGILAALKSSERPGFLEVLTDGQKRFYQACEHGDADAILVEYERGNAVNLNSNEIAHFNNLHPGQLDSVFNLPEEKVEFMAAGKGLFDIIAQGGNGGNATNKGRKADDQEEENNNRQPIRKKRIR